MPGIETITMHVGEAQVTVPKNAAVRAFLEELLNGRKVLRQPTAAPRIGELWREQGGTYAGIARGQNGAPDYYLIVAEPDQTSIKWDDAVKWAADLRIDGHTDYALPLRHEQAILYGNVPELFAKEWYWSGEQHASYSYYAWNQNFGKGYQYGYRKDGYYRARAVRRVVIE